MYLRLRGWVIHTTNNYSETLGAVLTAQTTYFTYLYYLCSIIICNSYILSTSGMQDIVR